MQGIVFYTLYPFVWLISILPFRLLYKLSDVLFFVVYYVIGYRKELVYSNLKRAFPDKDDREILSIRKRFYRHFVDIFMEMIKTFTITNAQINKRYMYKNIELLQKIADKGQSMVIVGGHYANWEWVVGMNNHIAVKAYGTYTQINNKKWEEKIKTTRERFGGYMVLKKDTIRNIAKNQKEGKTGIYGLLSDQSPQLHRAYYWRDFLHVRVPVYTGAEVIAKKYDLAFVFMRVDKRKRGYYEVDFELITDKPNRYENYALTDIFIEKLERQIRHKPEYYFWTHNRFKLEGKEAEQKR